jgi:hypothetical protein
MGWSVIQFDPGNSALSAVIIRPRLRGDKLQRMIQ